MIPLTDSDLNDLNRKGLIPGPTEASDAFLSRVRHCLHLHTLMSQVDMEDSCVITKEHSEKILLEAAPLTRRLFDAVPIWVPVFFSNDQLAPWHGGCAWIFQIEEDAPLGACFQLRKAFANRTRYLGIYSRSELIAHETAHVGRMMFQEPEFEEILAYRTAPSSFRRWFGPIVQSHYESMIFVFLLLLLLIFDLFFVFFGYFSIYLHAMWLKLIPLGMLAYGLYRLNKRQRAFQKCLDVLKAFLGDEEKANAVSYRLTDEEIWTIGKMSQEELKSYMQEQKKESLRWHVINICYT